MRHINSSSSKYENYFIFCRRIRQSRPAEMNHTYRALFTGLLLILLQFVHRAHSQEVVCRQRPMDLVFVLDGSRSVRPKNFQIVREEVKKMIRGLEEISPQATQVGLVQYSSRVRQEFNLDKYYTKEDLEAAVDRMQYMQMGTMTGEALKHLVNYSFQKWNGARMDKDTKKVAVVITDGRSQDRTVGHWQKKAKDSGIELFAVGIGRRISDKDLLQIASDPKSKHKFYAKNFEALRNLDLIVAEEICDVDECEFGNHTCMQICINTFGSFICDCNEGYRLLDDGSSCVLYDPCRDAGCGYKCRVAPPNGFRCTCPPGFKLNRDERTCGDLKPPAPQDISFSEVTHTSMRVSWELDRPENADQVLNYVVVYERTDGEGGGKTAEVKDPTIVLEDLTPGTSYSVSVSAVTENDFSSSVDGDETTLFLGETQVTVSDPTLTTLTASWQPAGGDLLSGYDVTYSKTEKRIDGEPNVGTKQLVGPDIHQMVLRDLEPGTEYQVEVTPLHGKLKGGAGKDTGTTKTLQAPVADIPETTVSTATVVWSDIDVESYTVAIHPEDDPSDIQTKKVSGDELSVTFGDLMPETDYVATVKGHVTDDDKEHFSPTATANGKTKTLPSAQPRVTSTTLSTAVVEWDEVKADSCGVEIYPTSDPSKIQNQEVTESQTSTVFRDLMPDTDYITSITCHVEDDGKTFSGPTGTAEGKTKKLERPDVEITETTISTADVMWTVSGIYPQSFTVSYCPSGGEPEDKKTIKVEDISVKLEDLEPDTEYTVEVVSHVTDDDKIFTSDPGLDTDRTKPLPVPTVHAAPRTLTSATVRWEVDYIVDRYRLTYFPKMDETQIMAIVLDGDVNETVLYDLPHDSSYTVLIVAQLTDGGKHFTTTEGMAMFTLGALDPPVVKIPETTTMSLVAMWMHDVDAERYEVTIVPVGQEEALSTVIVDGAVMEYTFDHLTPATEYEVTVVAHVQDEEQELVSPPGSSVNFTKPAPPENLRAPDIAPTSVEVTFDPSQGGSDYYEAVCVPSGGNPADFVPIKVEKPNLTFTCEDLIPGMRYDIYVLTVFRMMRSDFAKITERTVVGPPLNFDMSEPTPHSIKATWQPPEGVTQPNEYALSYTSPDQVTETVTIPGSETEIVLDDLIPSTEYTGSIKAVFTEIVSPAATDNETTLPDIVNLDVVDVGYNKITVSWPTSLDPNVRRYELSYVPREESGTTEPEIPTVVSVGPETTSYVISDAKPATIYDMTLKNVYRVGNSPAAAAEATTLAPPPGPLDFSNNTVMSFVVSWGYPEFDAAPVGYTVSYEPHFGQGVVDIDIPHGEVLNTEIADLNQGSEYNVSVVANYHYDITSEQTEGTGSTLYPPEQDYDGGFCDCNMYMDSQYKMQQVLESLVKQIDTLNRKIDNLQQREFSGDERSKRRR